MTVANAEAIVCAGFRGRGRGDCALEARAAGSQQLAIVGGGARAGLGRPGAQEATKLATTRLRGDAFYEPTEMVIGVRAGTPVA